MRNSILSPAKVQENSIGSLGHSSKMIRKKCMIQKGKYYQLKSTKLT